MQFIIGMLKKRDSCIYREKFYGWFEIIEIKLHLKNRFNKGIIFRYHKLPICSANGIRIPNEYDIK